MAVQMHHDDIVMFKYHWHDVYSTLQLKLRDFLNSDIGAFVERLVYLQLKDSKKLAHEIKEYENVDQDTDPEKYKKLHSTTYLWGIIDKWAWTTTAGEEPRCPVEGPG